MTIPHQEEAMLSTVTHSQPRDQASRRGTGSAGPLADGPLGG